MPVEDTNLRSLPRFEIENPALRREPGCRARQGVVVALDVDHAAPFPSPPFRELRKLQHELVVRSALDAPEAVDNVAVQHHQLRVPHGFGQMAEPVRVMPGAKRPAKVDVGKEQGTLHRRGGRHFAAFSTGRRGVPARRVPFVSGVEAARDSGPAGQQAPPQKAQPL